MEIHETKINKAKVKLQLGNPFFSYLSLFLKIKPDLKGELPDNAGGGVNCRGELTYRKEWVEKISDEEVSTFLAHEILHLAFNHLTRLGTREMEIFNVACDLVVNNSLSESGFCLIEGGLNPRNNCFEFEEKGKVIYEVKDIHKKVAEMIYDELMKNLPKKYITKLKIGRGKGHDKHEFGKMGIGEKEENEELWKKRIEEAGQLAKMVGKLPSGIERYLDELKKGKLNWKSILERYIQKSIPSDYTYMKRSKKSVACGVYLPSTTKERVNVSVAIDTSGSIGKDELTTFMSEITSLAQAYKERIDMRVVVCDSEVGKDYLIENGNVAKLKKLELIGGGGTSHIEVVNYCKDKIRENKLLICFTDGYSDLEQIDFGKYPFDVLIVLTKNGNENLIGKLNCGIIQLKDE